MARPLRSCHRSTTISIERNKTESTTMGYWSTRFSPIKPSPIKPPNYSNFFLKENYSKILNLMLLFLSKKFIQNPKKIYFKNMVNMFNHTLRSKLDHEKEIKRKENLTEGRLASCHNVSNAYNCILTIYLLLIFS